MTATATYGDLLDTLAPHRQDAQLAALIRRLAALRPDIATGTHYPRDHWPAHATPAYYARKRRPTLRQRLARTVRALAGRLSPVRGSVGKVVGS